MSYKHTWIGKQFLRCCKDVLALFFGNQAGKGALAIINYILRIHGCHPVPKKNILYYKCETAVKFEEKQDEDGEEIEQEGHYYSPKQITDMGFGVDPYTHLYSDKYLCKKCEEEGRGKVNIVPHIRQGPHRIIRFASQNMPGSEKSTTGAASKNSSRDDSTGTGETKNTQYIELMKWMPAHLFRDKKISLRDPTLRIIDPFPTGLDIIIEFVSFGQMIQSGAGVQRISTWIDELAAKEFFDEQIPRMLAVDGADIILTYTVTKEVGYLFDLIWNRARYIYRSKSIRKHYLEKDGLTLLAEEETDSMFKNIAMFHASTYDNPTLNKNRVKEMMMLLHGDCDNEDVMEMRLFCKFKEISSFIFSMFENRIHVVDPCEYFTDTGEVIIKK